MDFWEPVQRWIPKTSGGHKMHTKYLYHIILCLLLYSTCVYSLQIQNQGWKTLTFLGFFSVIRLDADDQNSVICNSLAFQPPDKSFVKFLCFCRDRLETSEFSLADFLVNISPVIHNMGVNITFRHCWSMRIYFDLEDLYQVKNDKVQPNLFIKHLGIENIVEVSMEKASFGRITGPNPLSAKLDSNEIKSLSNMTVSLAGVSRIQLQADLPVLAVEALEPGIMAFVDLMNQTESEITLKGFESGNIMVAGTAQSPTSQINEFQHVLSTIEDNISARSNLLSMVLIGCACVVALGLVASLVAVFKRNQYLIQAVVYSSIGSLRRGTQNKNLNINNSNNNSDKSDADSITTTTQISFFPKYSVKEVNSVRNTLKSQKSRTGSTPNLSGSTTKLNEKPRGTSHGQVGASPVVRGGSKSQRSHKHHKGEMVKDHVARAKRSRSVPAKERDRRAKMDEATALGINLSMRIKSLSRMARLGTLKKPPPPPPPDIESDIHGKDVEKGVLHRTPSFYYQPPSDTSAASSKSDLTGRRHHNLAIPVSVDVHKPPAAVATNPQPFHHDSSDNQSSSEQDISIPYPAGGDSTRIKVENLLRNQSPQPLIGVDRKYSFIDIREKCRKLIQFHLNSSNTKM